MSFRPLLCCLLLSGVLSAQSTPRETLSRLFAGMRTADTTGMAALFHPAATLQSVVEDAGGGAQVQGGDIGQWLQGITRAGAGDLDEQLHYTEIRMDGGLATAWTPYTFVLRGEVHHCGTNAFQLVRDGADDMWRILNIVDTRKTEGCAIPDTVATVARLDTLATRWHQAAARADSAAFFDALTDDAVYIGTDPGEHWTKAEFLAFAAPYFAAGKAWDFTATERHIFFDEDENLAYWDELLTTWMGQCRGTAVVRRDRTGEWKIVHYTLSLSVPNPRMEAVIETIGAGRK